MLIEQHQEIRKRLQLAALEEPYKSKWEAELKGGGNGTNIMAHVFTEEPFWKGNEGWLLFFNYMITKMSNEAVVESMGGVLDRHASGERHLHIVARSLQERPLALAMHADPPRHRGPAAACCPEPRLCRRQPASERRSTRST